MNKGFFIVIISAFIFGIAPAVTYAITVGPAKMEFSSDPGDVIKGSMFVMNEGNSEETFYPTFQKFIEVDGEKRFLGGEPTEVANWFKTVDSVKLGAGQQKDIPFTIELALVHASLGENIIVLLPVKTDASTSKLAATTSSAVISTAIVVLPKMLAA